MSRKRKRVPEETVPGIKEPDENQVNGIVDDQAPLPLQPLEFSMETLNQIHTTCTTSIPVQQPLLEGTPPFPPQNASSYCASKRSNFSTDASPQLIGLLQTRIETN